MAGDATAVEGSVMRNQCIADKDDDAGKVGARGLPPIDATAIAIAGVVADLAVVVDAQQRL